MEKIYKIDLMNEDMSKIIKLMEKIEKLWLSDHFQKYLGKILKKELKKIQKRKLSTINTNEDIKESVYMNSNHLEIDNGNILIYNDAVIDIADKNMSETTKSNYPAQLSLAKIVEYGIGYTGSLYANDEVEDWDFDVNQHGSKGWYYRDKGDVIHWTNGFAGRYIFLELKRYVEDNIEKILEDYLEDMLKEF